MIVNVEQSSFSRVVLNVSRLVGIKEIIGSILPWCPAQCYCMGQINWLIDWLKVTTISCNSASPQRKSRLHLCLVCCFYVKVFTAGRAGKCPAGGECSISEGQRSKHREVVRWRAGRRESLPSTTGELEVLTPKNTKSVNFKAFWGLIRLKTEKPLILFRLLFNLDGLLHEDVQQIDWAVLYYDTD